MTNAPYAYLTSASDKVPQSKYRFEDFTLDGNHEVIRENMFQNLHPMRHLV